MTAESALANQRQRHFDRGFRFAAGLPAVLMLFACSGSLVTPDAGSGGIAQQGSGGGGSAGTAIATTGGRGGAGGIGGSNPVPTCADGAPTFGVCIVNDADVLPLPDIFQDTITGAATVVAVGTGTAPAQCESARLFGAPASSAWWLQARTADNRLWTIGIGGLGNAPLVHTGDRVTLDLDYRRYSPFGGPSRSAGRLQLSDAAAVPLLWTGADAFSTDWMTLTAGDALCNLRPDDCVMTRHDVIATVNGTVATLSPFSAAYVNGYYLVIGEYITAAARSITGCMFFGPPGFAAAAVKVP